MHFLGPRVPDLNEELILREGKVQVLVLVVALHVEIEEDELSLGEELVLGVKFLGGGPVEGRNDGFI